MNLHASPFVTPRVSGMGALVSFLDNRSADTGNINFDRGTYHFTLRDTGEDVTNQIRRADKEANWAGFDAATDNERLYVEKYIREHGTLPPDVGPTSTWAVLLNNLATDPLGAPLEVVNNAWNDVVNSSGVKGFALVGGLALVLYLVLRK